MSAKLFVAPCLALLLATSLPADEAAAPAAPDTAARIAELDQQIQTAKGQLSKLSEQLHKVREATLQDTDGYAEKQKRMSSLLTQLSALSKNNTLEPTELAAQRKALTTEITTLSQQINKIRKSFVPDENAAQIQQQAGQLVKAIEALEKQLAGITAEVKAAAKETAGTEAGAEAKAEAATEDGGEQ